ncbi:MAG: O-antigen ligase family protein [Patescibacteria group bacterium]|nr:O-antigen ligase family protein [Patescibacteria group bacterium]
MTQKNNSWPLIIFSALVLVPLLYFLIFTNPSWIQIAQIAVLIVILPIFFWYEELGFFALIVLRPALDVFSENVLVKIGQFPLNLSSVVSLITIGWAAWYFLRHRVKIWKQPLFWPFAIFALLGVISFVYTESLSATLREVLRLGSILFLFLMAGNILDSREKFQRLIKSIGLSLIIPLLVGTYQLFSNTGLSFAGVNNRIYGTFGHPNALAFYLVLSLGLFISYYFQEKTKKSKWFLAGLGMMFLFLLLTYTRGAWIGFLIFLMILGFMRFRKIVIALVIAAILLITTGPIIDHFTFNQYNFSFTSIPVIKRLTDETSDESSIDWRLKVWSDMSRKITERPLFGYGLGAFPVIREQSVKGFFESTEAHNDYLRLAIELGFVGLFFYVLLLGKLLYNLVRNYRVSHDLSQKSWILGGIALTIAFAAMSFFDNLLQGTAVMWAFWSTMAVIQKLPSLK